MAKIQQKWAGVNASDPIATTMHLLQQDRKNQASLVDALQGGGEGPGGSQSAHSITNSETDLEKWQAEQEKNKTNQEAAAASAAAASAAAAEAKRLGAGLPINNTPGATGAQAGMSEADINEMRRKRRQGMAGNTIMSGRSAGTVLGG